MEQESHRFAPSIHLRGRAAPERVNRGIVAMPESKLVFIDLDGTLIALDQKVPSSAVEAMRAAKSRGHILIMCTGRSMPEIYSFLWDYGFSGAVTGAGSYVTLDQEVLFDRRLGAQTIHEVNEVWQSLNGLWVWQSPEEIAPSPGFMDFFVEKAGLAPNDWAVYAETISPYLKEGVPSSSAKCTAYISKGITTPERLRELIPEELSITEGSVGAGDTLVYEVAPRDISKGTGVKLVADRLGYDIEDTIAIGDSMNDVEALLAAGRGIAMGGSPAPVLQVADHVTDRLEDDGLAKAFAFLGLID